MSNDAPDAVGEDRANFFKLKSQAFLRQIEAMSNRLTSTRLGELDEDELQVQLKLIDKSQKAFDLAHDSLEELDYTQIGSDLRDRFDETAASLEAKIKGEIRKKNRASIHSSTLHPSNSDEPQPDQAVVRLRPKLPELKLPSFGGDYTEWMDFYSVFNTIVGSDTGLSKIEKFQHLRSCLTDAALDTVRSLEISEVNYDTAIELLEKRFNKKRLIFQAHIREILGLKKMEKKSVDQLRELTDKLNAHMRALQAISNQVNIANFILIQTFLQKVDGETRAKWEESFSFDDIPSWDSFSSFLEKRCQALENLEHAMATSTPSNPVGKNNKNKSNDSSKRSLFSGNASSTNCVFCDSTAHSIYSCSRFGDLTPSARLKEVKRLLLCINCLKKGHQVRACRSSPCKTCGVKHHTLLHLKSEPIASAATSTTAQANASATSPSQVAAKANPTASPSSPSVSLAAQNLNSNVVLLATAVVLVKNRFGSYVNCRALLDSGSQLNFITSRLVNQLNLKKTKCSTLVSGIGDTQFSSEGFAVNICFQSKASEYSTSTAALVASTITDNLPHQSFDISAWNIPPNVRLADPQFHKSQRIDLLIGASLFFELLCVGQIQLVSGLPLLQKTRLGWIVSGVFQHSSKLSALAAHSRLYCNAETNVSIDTLVRRFWEVEDCLDPIVKISQEEIDCEAHFKANYTRSATGEYFVRLPLKLSLDLLGDSYNQARRRLLNLERKLARHPELKIQYSAFIKEYLELKHMSPVDTASIGCCKYFLPHHCVIKEDSTTTRLRVVFDGSAKSSSGYSLNDILMVGPTIQPKLFHILLRFRTFPITLTGDICKMYRCVRVSPPDNFLQCILWRDSPDDELQIFKLDTVTYGTKPAAFLSIRAMHQLSLDEAANFPVGSHILQRDFYVDDLITGGNSIEEVLEIKQQITALLDKGFFKIRKWCSNDPVILKEIPDADKETLLKFDSSSDITKTLGLVWNPSSDHLLLSFSSLQPLAKPCKRTVLSTIARFYDPLGLAGPLTAKVKIFMQRLWREKLNWDESLPHGFNTAWQSICRDLENSQLLSFPRFVLQPNSSVEIHGFCDASLEAYGACIYVVCSTANSAHSLLLCSKSRVSPLKTLTVPKLELCAAFLLSHLIFEVSQLKLFDCKFYCWSDSLVTLSWLKQEPAKFNIFVSNRVSIIQQKTFGMEWRYVPTASNPADILSRGALASELRSSTLWSNGPSFLIADRSQWPQTAALNTADLPEIRKKTLLATSADVDISISLKHINNFGSMQRTFAYIYKFMQRNRTRGLTASDVLHGTHLLLRHVQQIALAADYKAIKSNNFVKPSSCLISLSPFLDNFGILRVGGRLKNSTLSFEARHPIILPKNHPLTFALIKQFHEKNLHAGPSALLASIRQQYWPIGGRKTVSRVVNKCVRCFRARPRLLQHIMGDLPRERVETTRTFAITGVDYCGPFYYKPEARNKQLIKCYVSVFVCFTTKAIHLELVKDLSTSAFLSALKRFIYTRGRPSCIWSDNATNFVGAKNELAELQRLFLSNEHQTAVHQYCLGDNIDWRFIPPRSPHFGGLWEAAVKTAKFHFVRSVGPTPLDFEELRTLICHISAIVNSRPLFPISEDPSDLNVLTPAHFLIGAPFTSIIEPDVTQLNFNRLDRWQRVSYLQQIFWKRWSAEYLTLLQQRSKWRTVQPALQVNDLVLIKDENLPSLKWPLARIIDLVKGKDNVSRVAILRTATGTSRRAISKLCLLPLKDAEDPEPSPGGGCSEQQHLS